MEHHASSLYSPLGKKIQSCEFSSDFLAISPYKYQYIGLVGALT